MVAVQAGGVALNITFISFDLDGTLIDTAAPLAEAVNRALNDAGIARLPANEVIGFVGAGTRSLVARSLAKARVASTGAPLDEDWLYRRFDAHYAQLAGSHERVYDGCGAMLTSLREAGVRLACITNKESRFVKPVLAAAGLDEAFDAVICGDTLPVRKPEPALFAHAVKMAAPSHGKFAHVGDSDTDIEFARRARVLAWAVPWGYNGGKSIQHAAPDRLFDSLPEIARHVRTQNGWPC